MAKSGAKNTKILLEILKWFVTSFIAILIGSYINLKLGVTNDFLTILLITFILSIIIQIVRSHETGLNFKLNWFIFYFLTYAIILWAFNEFFFLEFIRSINLFYFLITSVVIASIIYLIQKLKIRSDTIPWISFVLFLILIVANLANLQNINSTSFSIANSSNFSIVSGDKALCPGQDYPRNGLIYGYSNLVSDSYQYNINLLINSSIWRTENNLDSCYQGKYRGQYPNWIYCDNMIVSRWDIGTSGAIKDRWYTAVTAEWKPQDNYYILNGLSCENGQRVTIEKGKTNYYVYDSREGNQISIAY